MAMSADGSSTNLSDLVKEMVKEMDANEFYARGDMYDESAEEPWFNIDIYLEHDRESGGGTPPASTETRASLRKPWSEFQRLHYLLLTDEFGCDEPVKRQLPTLPTNPETLASDSAINGGAAAARDTASALSVYLNHLLAVPAVVQSQVFGGFLDDHSRRAAAAAAPGTEVAEVSEDLGRRNSMLGAGGAGGGSRSGSGQGGDNGPYEPETAIDFLVQPFDYTNAYLPRRGVHTEQIDVLRGESVVWKFELLDHLDIDFSVVFRPHPFAVPSHLPDSGDDDPPVDESAFTDQDDVTATAESGIIVKPSSPGPRSGPKSVLPRGKDEDVKRESVNRRSSGRRRGSRWWGAGGGGGKRDGDDVEGAEERKTEKSRLHGDSEHDADETEQEKTVHLPTRYSTGGGDPVQGSFTCPADGTCILRWDNSYSRLRGKRLCFVMESATVQTMRAAIEAAGAADHKRRATLARSAAAQTILDSSGSGHAKIRVTAVGTGDINGFGGDGETGGAAAAAGDFDSGEYDRFGRVRRVAADLLRDLGTIVDGRRDSVGNGGPLTEGFLGGDGNRSRGRSPSSSGDVGGVGQDGSDARRRAGKRCGNVEIEGVEKLVARFELLEDEVASASARRAQSEAQAKVLLATLQKANTKADRFERTLEETYEQLRDTQIRLDETEVSRDEEARAATAATTRMQASEEQLLRAKRERDLLQAERSVWQVARSGIQEELAKVVAELELERHKHEDASRALAKSHESRAHAEAEAARLTRRLEEERGGVGGIRAALATEREAARLAHEEAEDARAAVADLDAAVAELGAQKRVLVTGLRARERALGDRCAAAEARAEESGMMRRAAEARVKELEEDTERREALQADAEVRLQRLRAEKKVLLAEVRRGVGSGIIGGAMGGGGDDASSVGSGGGGGAGKDWVKDGASDAGEGDTESEMMSPLRSSDAAQDNKATLKQLSRQLVHLRERQHHLREDLRSNPDNASAQRLEADVDRAVQNLETRVRKLLALVTGGSGGEASAASSSASSPASSIGKGEGRQRAKTTRKVDAFASRESTVGRGLSPQPTSATDVETTERYSV